MFSRPVYSPHGRERATFGITIIMCRPCAAVKYVESKIEISDHLEILNDSVQR